MSWVRRLRQAVGALLLDVPGFVWRLRAPRLASRRPLPWVKIRNRREVLDTGPDGRGVRPDWRWTSELHAARLFPPLGSLLMRRAALDWPFTLVGGGGQVKGPAVTFVMGHRGRDRLDRLLVVLASIRGQEGVTADCVVVEQDSVAHARTALPAWVTYLHSPPPHEDMPYGRSWAFNVGAKAARASILVFHDADILVPQAYAAEIVGRVAEGFEVVNLKRFIFYLSEGGSVRTAGTMALALSEVPTAVVQNAQGGSIAVTPSALDAIGGFDETFIGWGGEDNEFWERCQTRRVYPWGYLPFVHLWHPPQPAKAMGAAAPTHARYLALSAPPVEERIRTLRMRPRGLLSGPRPEWTAPSQSAAL